VADGFYRELVEIAAEGILVADFETRRFVYANPAICELLGYTRSELLEREVGDIHPPEALARVLSEFRELGRGERTLAPEIPCRRRDGSLLFVDILAKGTRIGDRPCIVGFFVDVTERHRAEVEQREVARVLRESQRVGRLGSYRLDVATGLWTSSPVLDEIFGIAGSGHPKDVSGWVELVHPEERAEMAAYFQGEVLGRRRSFDREYRIVRRFDGATRWVHGRGELLEGPGGEVVEMIGTIQDVTDRRAAEGEKLELERRLLQAQKLESIGLLAGGVAHDFNNLLLAIQGNLELALSRLPAGSPAVEFTRRAIQATERSAELTRQLLAYSGQGATVSRVVDLRKLVQDDAHLLGVTVGRGILLRLDLPPGIAPVRGDPGQLEQIVLNLIANAAEAIGPRGGTIRLATGTMECDATALARSRVTEVPPPGRYVFLEVADDGCGMDEATQQRLFDPFFSTKRLGRGLGMAAILGIVRAHRGAILVESRPGAGTRIRVLLPEAAAVEPEPVSPSAS